MPEHFDLELIKEELKTLRRRRSEQFPAWRVLRPHPGSNSDLAKLNREIKFREDMILNFRIAQSEPIQKIPDTPWAISQIQGQNFLPKHITNEDLAIMRETTAELERLWGEISKVKGDDPKIIKERAKQFFRDYEEAYDGKWRRLRIEFLEDDALYGFSRWGQEKEDLIGRLHQKILLADNPVKRRNKPGAQRLYDIHLLIVKGQPVKE